MEAMQVLPIPSYTLREQWGLIEEFQNSTHWPKHLLVRYHWAHSNALNVNAAMYVLFTVGKPIPAWLAACILHRVRCDLMLSSWSG